MAGVSTWPRAEVGNPVVATVPTYTFEALTARTDDAPVSLPAPPSHVPYSSDAPDAAMRPTQVSVPPLLVVSNAFTDVGSAPALDEVT